MEIFVIDPLNVHPENVERANEDQQQLGKKRGTTEMKCWRIDFTSPANSRCSFFLHGSVAALLSLLLVSNLLPGSKLLLSPKRIISCVLELLASPALVQ